MAAPHRHPPPTGRSLRDAVRALVLAYGILDDTRRPCGASLPTPHAWALLELLGGPTTVGALATKLNIDRTNVSRLCRRMEELGEVERVPSPDDGRARLVRLTPAGEAIARSVDASSAAHFATVLQRLPSDPRDTLDALASLRAAMTETS